MRQDYKLVTVRGLFDSKESYADKTVTVGGWIRNNRDSKAIGFIALADGSCFQNLQLVYSKDLENLAEIAKITGRREATVRSDLKRARDKLRELLKEADDFE